MKRLMRYYNTFNSDKAELLKLSVEVIFDKEEIAASSILDINDSAYFDFKEAILMACGLRDFELVESYQSDIDNSISQYYIYTKTDPEGVKLKIIVEIRISDHPAPGRDIHGQFVSQQELRNNYLKQKAKRIAEEKYGQKRGFKWRAIDIIFNDDHFTSYEDALREIENRLDEFDPESKYI